MKDRIGKVIEEFKIGNTSIKINDAYMEKDKDEIDRILGRVSNIVMNAYAAGRVIGEGNPYLSKEEVL